MRYGLHLHDDHRLFPVGITTVERTPDGNVKLVLAHSTTTTGTTPVGNVILNADEAAELADEIRTMSQQDHPHHDNWRRSTA
jgi:hypothetical protein